MGHVVYCQIPGTDSDTRDSLLDLYAKRIVYQVTFPNVTNLNFIDFATKFKIKKGKLETQSPNVVPRVVPCYSSHTKGENYYLYCKYQLLKFKPRKDCQNDAWGNVTASATNYLSLVCLFCYSLSY